MSTPPDTETFVTGDRIIYKFAGRKYTGTIKSVHPRLEGWYVVHADGFGESALPGVNMEKLEFEYVKPAKLNSGPSLEDFKARLAELSSTLEKKLKDVSDEMEYADLEDYHFDAGFTAGLRVALNDLAKLSESL